MDNQEIRRIVIEALAYSKVMSDIDDIVNAVIKEEEHTALANAIYEEKMTSNNVEEFLEIDKSVVDDCERKINARTKMNLVADAIIKNGGYIDDRDNTYPSAFHRNVGAVVALNNGYVSLWLGSGDFLRAAYVDDFGKAHLSDRYDEIAIGGFSKGNIIPSPSDIRKYNETVISSQQIIGRRRFSLDFIEA